MRIVIDGRMSGERWTGIGLYGRHLIEQLQQVDQENEYIVLLARAEFDQWKSAAPNFEPVLANYKVYGLAEQLILPFKLLRLRPDLVHFLHFNAPCLWRGRRVVTIHDLTYFDYLITTKTGLARLPYILKHWGMRWVVGWVVSDARIVTPTEATKAKLIKRYNRGLWRVKSSDVTVTPEAVDPPEKLPTHTLTHRPANLLYVGNLYPYKNVGALIKALPKIRQVLPGTTLTIVGQTSGFGDQLKRQAADLGLGEAVKFEGFVTPSQLATRYGAATLFVFPSLAEGFGLPPLEAMAQGTPVLAARASCLPEVLGSVAHFFDPTDPGDLAKNAIELLNDPKKLVQLQTRGFAHIKTFSWQRMAEQTLGVYKSRV